MSMVVVVYILFGLFVYDLECWERNYDRKISESKIWKQQGQVYERR